MGKLDRGGSHARSLLGGTWARRRHRSLLSSSSSSMPGEKRVRGALYARALIDLFGFCAARWEHDHRSRCRRRRVFTDLVFSPDLVFPTAAAIHTRSA